MRFKETLRKRLRESGAQRPASAVKSAMKAGAPSSTASSNLIPERDIKIGVPNSTNINNGIHIESDVTGIAYETSASHEANHNDLENFTHVTRTHYLEESNINSRLVAITQPNSIYSEEYRRIRNRIIKYHKNHNCRSIVISSATAGEGKSVTALNLALMLAGAENLRVLIIDSDMRNGRIASYLGIEEACPGLSDFLSGQVAFSETLISIEPTKLFLLPAGQCRNDVPELLVNDAFLKLRILAERHFDLVIVDTPPIGFFSDASSVIEMFDALLLIVGTNQIAGHELRRTVNLVPKEKLLGLVLNRANETLARSDDYESAYYYSNY